MNRTLLSCLLAVSTMFSVQAFIVINKTKQTIEVGGFGFDRGALLGDIMISLTPIKLPSNFTMDTAGWNAQSFDLMTVIVDGQDYPFRGLTLESTVTVDEDENGVIRFDRE